MIGRPPRPASAQAKAQRSWRMRVVIATSLMCLLAGCASGSIAGAARIGGAGRPAEDRHPARVILSPARLNESRG